MMDGSKEFYGHLSGSRMSFSWLLRHLWMKGASSEAAFLSICQHPHMCVSASVGLYHQFRKNLQGIFQNWY
jgi:hypothetical protein